MGVSLFFLSRLRGSEGEHLGARAAQEQRRAPAQQHRAADAEQILLDGLDLIKLLVCSALICLIQLGQLPAWVVIIIISREFIISGFRLVAADNGIVIAASYWGKFKTTFQMIAVILMIFNIPALATVTMIMLVIAVVLTVISLVDYVAKNIEVLTKGGM